MNIKQHIIEQIKEQIDIVDVLGDFLTMKKVGQNYRALSPFTDEKTPSFYISPSKGIFKDFSSGKGGDAIAFIMELEGLSYLEAIKYLGRKYGIEIEEEEQSDEELAARNERESLFIALNFANKYFQDLLWNNDEGRSVGLSYFKERKFTDQIVKEFELGYALSTWDGLMSAAVKKGFKADILEKAGLIVRNESKEYDRFRGRVLFPIHNITGKPIGFGARILVNDKKQPKYINSPETEIYNKSQVLYGMFQGKHSIRNEDNCYLVEGYTDVISMHMAGVKNVVSSSGTSLTAEQIKLIGRYTKNITVLFDGDAAGIRASLRGVDMILEQGMNVKVVAFEEGEDPDSFAAKSGSSAFQEYLNHESQDFIKFKVGLFVKESANDPIKKADTIKNIVESIAKIPDPIQRAIYLQECSKLLDIDESILIAEQNKILIKLHQNKKKSAINQAYEKEALIEKIVDSDQLDQEELVAINSQEWQEKETVRILLSYGFHIVEEDVKLGEYLLQELSEIEFNTPVYAEIITIFKQKLHAGEYVNAKYFIENGSESVKNEVIDLTTERYDVSDNWNEMYKIYVPKEEEILSNLAFSNVHRLKLRVIQRLIDNHMEELKNTQDHNQQEAILKVISSYKKTEMALANVLGNIISR